MIVAISAAIFFVLALTFFMNSSAQLLHAIARKPCPFCKEQVAKTASMCPHCRKDLPVQA